MIPYEAYIHATGDVFIKVNGKSYEDCIALYSELDNYDVILEDKDYTVIAGSMAKEQFKKLVDTSK